MKWPSMLRVPEEVAHPTQPVALLAQVLVVREFERCTAAETMKWPSMLRVPEEVAHPTVIVEHIREDFASPEVQAAAGLHKIQAFLEVVLSRQQIWVLVAGIG